MFKILITLFLLFEITIRNVSAQTINAPSDLSAEPENFSYIKVRWDDNSNNEEGFNIERSLVNDTTIAWETIGAVNQNVRTFFDYWVTNQVTYYYRAYAFSGTLRSAYSNIAYATAIIDTINIPRAPSNLIVLNTTPSSITIGWNDNSNNEAGFIIARRREGEILFRYIDTVAADILTYQEVGLTPDNVYFYKVCSYNSFGLSDFTNTVSARTIKSTGIISQESNVSESYFLQNNFPNPFNPSTTIRFGIKERSFISLKIYNSSGKEEETLINSSLSPGTYSVKWNAGNFSSGVYFYRLVSDNFQEVKKMIYIK